MLVMKVCIIRNAEAKSNAGIYRIVDSLLDLGYKPITLTRSRFNNKSGKFSYKPFKFRGTDIENYELQYQTEVGRGIKSIFQLLIYQFTTTIWLLKNRNKFDVIHAFDLDSGIPAVISSILTKKKLIYHVADFYIDSRQGIPSKLKNFVKQLEYFLISRADATIVCTEERKEQIKGSKPKKLYVVHNSPIVLSREELLLNSEHKENGELNSGLTLGYVGGLTEPRFIKQVLNIVKNNQKLNLKIAGFGYLESLVEETAKNYDNISFFGRISYENALKLYSECDLMFAMYDPTVQNNKYSAPNKVYEAMMLGLPIIVAKGTGIDGLVESEKIGLSVNYGEKEFDEALKILINDKKRLSEYKKNSKKSFKKYSWNKMKKVVQQIYKDL